MTFRKASRYISSAFVALIAIFFIAPAHAGTVHWTCHLPGRMAENPRFKDAEIIVDNGSVYPNGKCDIGFKGEIETGDSEKIYSAIFNSPNSIFSIKFDSLGGNPFEALKISDILNKYYIQFNTEVNYFNTKCNYAGCEAQCASACALIFLSADQRVGTEVFIHRPSFPSDVFAGLSGPDAQSAYEKATKLLISELKSRHVPDNIIQAMMDISSDNVAKLPRNYPHYSPWLAEWLTAKCSPADLMDPKYSDFLFSGIPETRYTDAELARGTACRVDAVMVEQKRSQSKN